MFTGLVETTAVVKELSRRGPSARISLGGMSSHGPLGLGESVSVSGVCLTVTAPREGGFDADVSAETLAVTTLGALGPGARVNIERSLRLGDRMGGHVVLGHVDGVGTVRAVDPFGEASRVTVSAPADLAGFIAAKGSIALDGVSLTVNRVAGDGSAQFEVMQVPHTLAATTLNDWRAGQNVNIEVDVLARYVARQLETASQPARRDEALLAKLRDGGFLA